MLPHSIANRCSFCARGIIHGVADALLNHVEWPERGFVPRIVELRIHPNVAHHEVRHGDLTQPSSEEL
eukprot:8668762-Prorocentrum_lima.AAC.1